MANNVYYTVAAPERRSCRARKRSSRPTRSASTADIGAYSANAYAAAMIEIAAIEKAIKANGGKMPTRADVLKNIAATNNFDTPIGKIGFDANGDTTAGILSLYKITQRQGRVRRPSDRGRLVALLEVFFQQLVNGLSLGGIYALIALGYTMVYGIIELINFAHGDVYTLGTFFSLAILTAIGVSGELHGWPLIGVIVLAVVGSMLLCGIVGVLIERLAYRRLRNAPRLAPLITAIGMSFILENVMQLWHGPSPVPFPHVIPNPTLRSRRRHDRAKQMLVVGSRSS